MTQAMTKLVRLSTGLVVLSLAIGGCGSSDTEDIERIRTQSAESVATEAPSVERSYATSELTDGRRIQPTLAVGKSKKVNVLASRYWNDLYLAVNAGEVYQFSAREDQTWYDLTIPSTADGYPTSVILEMCKGIAVGPCAGLETEEEIDEKKRVRSAQLFTMMGNIGKDETRSFVIGSDSKLTMETSRRLYTFANDWQAVSGVGISGRIAVQREAVNTEAAFSLCKWYFFEVAAATQPELRGP
jgi:hypothetical protein